MAVTYNTAYNKITQNPPRHESKWFTSLPNQTNVITKVNPQATAGNAANAYQAQGDSMFDSSVASAYGGVGFAQEGIERRKEVRLETQTAVGQMNPQRRTCYQCG